MLARLAIGCMFALALCAGMVASANAAQPLPYLVPVTPPAVTQASFQQAPAEPVVPLEDFTSESGWLARWRADHQRRAASDGWIQTDRPSFTLSDSTVPKAWLQLESGYTYSYAYERIPGSRGLPAVDLDVNAHTLPELNLRWGLTNWAELRVRWGGVRMQNRHYESNSGSFNYDETLTANLEVGAKFQTTQQRGWIPKSAFVTSLVLPTADSDDDVTPFVDYIYTWSFSDEWSFGGSTGAYLSDVLTDPGMLQFFQSAILRYHWSPKLSWYGEWYTTLQKYSGDSTWSPVLDTGILWRPLANLQFDWRIGLPIGSEPQMDGVFTGVGASVRY